LKQRKTRKNSISILNWKPDDSVILYMTMNPLFRPLLAALSLLAFTAPQTIAAQDPVDEFLFQQFRLVEDPDGETNVRSEASLKSSVVRKVPSGSVVTVTEKTGDFYTITDGTYDGAPEFIHASRLKDVSGWKQITNASEGTLRHKGMVARVTATPFIAAEHEIEELSPGFYLVDGGHVWGRDGGLPHHSLKLSVTFNGTAVNLPAAAVADLYEPNLDSIVLLTAGDPAERALILMTNSDGAGGYCVVWAFENGRYRGRTVFIPS
jgi:hypothetical protein